MSKFVKTHQGTGSLMTECRESLEDFPGRESFGMNREESDFLGSYAKAGICMVEERVLNTNFSRSA